MRRQQLHASKSGYTLRRSSAGYAVPCSHAKLQLLTGGLALPCKWRSHIRCRWCRPEHGPALTHACLLDKCTSRERGFQIAHRIQFSTKALWFISPSGLGEHSGYGVVRERIGWLTSKCIAHCHFTHVAMVPVCVSAIVLQCARAMKLWGGGM